MADLKTRLGPKHDPQVPFTNQVWVNPALADPKQTPRSTSYPDVSPENLTPSPNPGQLSLLDRLNIKSETDEVNQTDSVNYAAEGRSKSLLERFQPPKLSTAPLPSPKPSLTVNNRHPTPKSTALETYSGDGRAFSKNTQGSSTSSNDNGRRGVHEDASNHVSFSQTYKNGVNENNVQFTPSSRGTSASQSRDYLPSAPPARITPQLTSKVPLVDRISSAPPAQGTLSPRTIHFASQPEPGLAQPQTHLPSEVDSSTRKDSLAEIRDKVLPIIQKNAAARASANTRNTPSHLTSSPIDLTVISDDGVITFARRSSAVNQELTTRGISNLPPKPTQMVEKLSFQRGVDPIRRISRDFSNDNISSSRIATSQSRHVSAEDRRMATRSPLSSSSHPRRDSADSFRRATRSPPPQHGRGSTTGLYRRSQSPSTFRGRDSSDDVHRFTKSPRLFPADHSGPVPFQSPSIYSRRSASPRRRSSLASRLDHERSPERYVHRRSSGNPSDASNNAQETYRRSRSPQLEFRRPRALHVRMDGGSLTHSRPTQSLYYDRRDSSHPGYSPSRRNWDRRSNSPYMRRRSASPRSPNIVDPPISEDTGRPSSDPFPDARHDPMQLTTDGTPSPSDDQAGDHKPATETIDTTADHEPGQIEDTQLEPPKDPLPCHNVPGIWFAEIGQSSMSTKICAFQIDDHTAQRWNINRSEPQRRGSNTTRKLSLRLCCIARKDFEECVASLVRQHDTSPRQMAAAIYALEKKWPLQGKLIITLNPDTPHKHVWLPHQIGPDYVSIQDFVREGQNIVQLVQLSDLSDFAFVLYATDNEEPTQHNPKDRPSSKDEVTMTNGTVKISPL